MVIKCDKCDKEFLYKSEYIRHTQRKNPCDKIKEFICNICLNKFSTNYTLIRHKNKKIPCISAIVKLEQENKLLKIENNSIINNTTNNNNNNTNNNTTNNIINNNIIIAREEVKNYIIDNCLTLKDIKQMTAFESVQEYIEMATVDKNHDEDNVLQNTKEISSLLKHLFCNVNLNKNFIFFKDFVEDQIYVRLNKEITKLKLHDMLYVIYEVFKELLNYDNLDNELQKFYKKYIKKYNEHEFIELDTKEIKNFARIIRDELDDSIIELYDDIQLRKNGKEKLLLKKKKDLKNKLKINKTERHNKLLEDDIKIPVRDPKKIYNILKKLYKDNDKFDDDYKIRISEKSFYDYDIKYIKLISYFVNVLYIQNKSSKIKYENNILYLYSNNKWLKKTLNDIYIHFIDEMINQLYNYQILITEDDISINTNIDIDNDYYEFIEYIQNKNYEYILKYMIINKESEINLNKKNIINSIVLV